MVSVQIFDLEGNPKTGIDLPEVFDYPLRPDIIKKAVLFQQSHRRQPQGRDPMAGKRTTAITMGTGHHLARQPRVKGSRYPKAQQVAFAPNSRGGRETHPPKSEKRIYKVLNKKEKAFAMCSAIAATSDKDLIVVRGHVVENIPQIPMVVVDDLEELKETKKAREVFQKLGLMRDVERVTKSLKIRAGRGTMRGRRTRHGVGPLLVVGKDRGVGKATENFLGVDVVSVENLNVELLAPGTHPGRLTIWTSSAIELIAKTYNGVDYHV
ncbi:50S ribosomal protein L4 [Candidatus Bathyarchaeota archaeon]|nr:50S ribosomal protein L4 [Candidatus Bathyarchaeota archaeon]